MPRDNSPKERQRKQLERKQARRASYDRILIVSAGSKTEPSYFGEIRNFYRLHGTNVQVHSSEFGTQPLQVVHYALELFEKGDRKKRIQPRAFERVYAVFDRDDHPTFHDALTLANLRDAKLRNDLHQPVIFKAVASVPSFELWLLLHFEDVQSSLHRDEVMERLRTYIPKYKKGRGDIFALTREKLSIATSRAEKLASKFGPFDEPQPYTAVASLVKLLTTLNWLPGQ